MREWCLEYLVRNSTIKINIINKLISRISLSHTDDPRQENHHPHNPPRRPVEAFILRIYAPNPWGTRKTVTLSRPFKFKFNQCRHESSIFAVESTLKNFEAGTSNPRYSSISKQEHQTLNLAKRWYAGWVNELKQWKTEIENSLLDGTGRVMEKLVSMVNTGRDAIWVAEVGGI